MSDAERPVDTARGLISTYRDTGLQAPNGLVVHVERALTAQNITVFSPANILPSPLQTKEYTKATLLGAVRDHTPSNEPPIDKAAWYALRASTIQEATKAGVSWEVITNMVAIHRALETEITLGHYESLIGLLAMQPDMSVRVVSSLPSRLRMARDVRAVAVMVPREQKPVVTVETDVNARLITNATTRQRYMALVQRAREEALGNQESRKLIVNTYDSMRRRW